MKRFKWVNRAVWVHRAFWLGYAVTLFLTGALLAGYSDYRHEKDIVSMLSRQPMIVLTNFNYRDWNI